MIERLLEKYFAGESTLEEERQLRRYFQQPDIPESLHPYRSLFGFFTWESRQEPSPGFDERFRRKLDEERSQSRHLIRLRTVLARVAAVLLLAFGIWWLYPTGSDSGPESQAIDWSQYEPEDAEEALQITQMALLKASGKLNEGAAKAAQKVSKVKELNRVLN